jgi:type III secretory pathway component EscR
MAPLVLTLLPFLHMDATSFVGRMRVFSIFKSAIIIDRCPGVIFLLKSFLMAMATYTIQTVQRLRAVKPDVKMSAN